MVNKGIYSGYLTADPELKVTENSKYCDFCIGIKRNYKNKNNEYDSDFVNLKVWGKSAEKLCENSKKGEYISCVAHVESSKYINKENQTRYVTELIVDELSIKPKEKTHEQNIKSKEMDFEYDRMQL